MKSSYVTVLVACLVVVLLYQDLGAKAHQPMPGFVDIGGEWWGAEEHAPTVAHSLCPDDRIALTPDRDMSVIACGHQLNISHPFGIYIDVQTSDDQHGTNNAEKFKREHYCEAYRITAEEKQGPYDSPAEFVCLSFDQVADWFDKADKKLHNKKNQ